MGVWGRPVLVQACVNGARRRAEHPAVPLSPDEIARDASRAVAAGAAARHGHPRAADGSETLDPAICDAVVAAVRGACPRIPIGLTTAIWIEPDAGRRLELVTSWAVPPDFVSINLSEAGVPELCDRLLSRRIGIEAGVWTVDDARTLAALGIADRCVRVLVEAQPSEARAQSTRRERSTRRSTETGSRPGGYITGRASRRGR